MATPSDEPAPGPAAFALRSGALAAGLAVALGAFGAHALEARLGPEMLEIWQTAVLYHMFHALGLLGVAAVALRRPDLPGLAWSARLMVAGILLFSGSLYGLALSGVGWLGAVTPLGGVAFLVAWGILATTSWSSRGA